MMSHIDVSNPAVQSILRELGYDISNPPHPPHRADGSCPYSILCGDNSPPYREAWAALLAHAESEEGLERNCAKVLTMHDVILLFRRIQDGLFQADAVTAEPMAIEIAQTPQAAAWRLLLKVRGIA